jgi:hypothetical protein
LAGSASWSDGPDWLRCDLVWRGVPRACTPGDVAQQDLKANCFKSWDVFGF